MRPVQTTINVDGSVSRSRDTLPALETRAPVDTSVVRGIARSAWAGAITAHHLTAATSLRNRDVANPFIEVASACGRRRAAYREDDAPARFKKLLARLTALIS